MLAKLIIKNVALIENAEIVFSEGLNVLSGETGAGKSVILDSINFILGAKADRNMIRYGETECMVKAEFTLPESSKAVATLRDMDIDTDGEDHIYDECRYVAMAHPIVKKQLPKIAVSSAFDPLAR
jgi:DNA repair protein RecN (Recombination protein N)